MAANSNPVAIVFSTAQRKQLEEFKVPERSIRELENVALPIAKLFLSSPRPVKPIRDRIEKVLKPLKKAHFELSKLVDPKTDDARLAGLLILSAACSQSSMTDATTMAERLGRFVAVVESALEPLSKQARKRATPRPVAEIYNALVRTHLADDGRDTPVPQTDHLQHPDAREVEQIVEKNRASKRWRKLAQVPWHLSSYTESAFHQIVGVCYQAMLGEQDDYQGPERAIKAFVKQLRARESKQRLEAEFS